MTAHAAPPDRPPRSGTGLWAQVAELAEEAERQSRDGVSELAPVDAALARRIAEDLAEAVGPGTGQEQLTVVERLERLREALAVLALGIARSHGHLAWFLARVAMVLSPVLQWSSPGAEQPRAFGALVLPTPDDLTDAEDAVRRLRSALTHTDAGTGSSAAGPGSGQAASADGRPATVPESAA
ncbi:hypothetical protein AB0C76_05275 [Kitasatospora sp. NPDC048722]|uniref:hypothetical protein n=1 Tax=Kitasatospora sp. NPDC048722 TaxID=3155639 RepID=UPI0033FA949E